MSSCPELRAMLGEAFERAEPAETAIVPLAARKGVNLRHQFERIIVKAGHTPLPRLFQNLRASVLKREAAIKKLSRPQKDLLVAKR